MPSFVDRHIGPRENDIQHMLKTLGHSNLDAFIDEIIPDKIKTETPLATPITLSEEQALSTLKEYAQKNDPNGFM